MPLTPFELGRPAIGYQPLPEQPPKRENLVPVETGIRPGRKTYERIFGDQGIFQRIQATTTGTIASIQKFDIGLQKRIAWERRDPTNIPFDLSPNTPLDKLERMKEQAIGSVFQQTDKELATIEAIRAKSPEKEIMRIEWLLAKAFAEIPEVVNRQRQRNELETRLRPLLKEYELVRLSSGTQRNHLERKIRPIAAQVLRFNHQDSIWQIHLCELIGYLNHLTLKSFDASGKNLTSLVCRTYWQTLRHYAALANPDSTNSFVEGYRVGILGLRTIINYLGSRNFGVYYPKIDQDYYGELVSVQDTEMAIDLCVVNSNRTAAAILQVKSHKADMAQPLLKDTPLSPGLTIDFAPIGPKLYESIPTTEKRGRAMRKMERLSTNPTNYGIVTKAKLIPYWIELYGFDEGQPVSTATGNLKKEAYHMLDPHGHLEKSLRENLGEPSINQTAGTGGEND